MCQCVSIHLVLTNLLFLRPAYPHLLLDCVLKQPELLENALRGLPQAVSEDVAKAIGRDKGVVMSRSALSRSLLSTVALRFLSYVRTSAVYRAPSQLSFLRQLEIFETYDMQYAELTSVCVCNGYDGED
jgi:hypothetical protein